MRIKQNGERFTQDLNAQNMLQTPTLVAEQQRQRLVYNTSEPLRCIDALLGETNLPTGVVCDLLSARWLLERVKRAVLPPNDPD